MNPPTFIKIRTPVTGLDISEEILDIQVTLMKHFVRLVNAGASVYTRSVFFCCVLCWFAYNCLKSLCKIDQWSFKSALNPLLVILLSIN